MELELSVAGNKAKKDLVYGFRDSTTHNVLINLHTHPHEPGQLLGADQLGRYNFSGHDDRYDFGGVDELGSYKEGMAHTVANISDNATYVSMIAHLDGSITARTAEYCPLRQKIVSKYMPVEVHDPINERAYPVDVIPHHKLYRDADRPLNEDELRRAKVRRAAYEMNTELITGKRTGEQNDGGQAF